VLKVYTGLLDCLQDVSRLQLSEDVGTEGIRCPAPNSFFPYSFYVRCVNSCQRLLACAWLLCHRDSAAAATGLCRFVAHGVGLKLAVVAWGWLGPHGAACWGTGQAGAALGCLLGWTCTLMPHWPAKDIDRND
jgi:hypothetical protein